MKLYIKQNNTFKEIITTRELAKLCKITKQAIQKNKYLKVYKRTKQTDYYILDDVKEFIHYHKYKRMYKDK